MAGSVEFTGPGGIDPAVHILKIRTALQPSVGDALYAGSLLIGEIRDRTFKGVDADGVPFTPYSKKYAARKAKELGHGRVDLFGFQHHAHMLNALLVMAGNQTADQSSISDSPDPVDLFSVGIFTSDELELRARVHNDGGTRMPQRRWLDANSNDVNMIEREMGQRIERRLQALG